MTEQEVIERIRYIKKQLKDDSPEMFSYTGHEIKALKIAISAFEEIQQYRALEQRAKNLFGKN